MQHAMSGNKNPHDLPTAHVKNTQGQFLILRITIKAIISGGLIQTG
jgi:hypothetical protein